MSGENKPWLKFYDDGTVDITLSRELEVNGAKLSVLTMREPTVSDQLAASEVKGSEAVKEISFFANLCTIAPTDLQRLPVRDYARLQAAFAAFID